MPLSHKHLHKQRDVMEDIQAIVGDLNNEQPQPTDAPNLHEARDVVTVIETVFSTRPKDFPGEVGGYVTQTTPISKPSPQPKPQPKKDDNKSSSQTEQKHTSAVPSEIRRPQQTSGISTLAQASGSATVPDSPNRNTGTADLSTASPTATGIGSDSGSSSDGLSAGAKAGIAFGALGGLLVLGLIIFAIVQSRKRKNSDNNVEGGEKFGASSGNPDHLDAMPLNAPRISLRPVTQFLPNWNVEKRGSKAGQVALAPAAAGAWDRPSTSASSNPANPFGSNAERVPSPFGEKALLTISDDAHGPSPFDDPMTAHGPIVAGGPAAAAAAAAAATSSGPGLTRNTSIRREGQHANDYTLPPVIGGGPQPASPTGTEFSVSSLPPGASPGPSQSAAAIAAAGGPPLSTVHRVQLDFKPTLDDEMELRAGDLVRLLHEYDDGWALCIRLDRTQQGVVPRTCLSTRPVKPRPPPGANRNGPPVNPQGGFPRGPGPGPGPGPNYNQGRMTPQGMRNGPPPGPPGPPGTRPYGPPSRPQSPSVMRPQSPSMRPQSPNVMARRVTPPGPPAASRMNQPSPPHSPPEAIVGRKPVPGQAY